MQGDPDLELIQASVELDWQEGGGTLSGRELATGWVWMDER